MCAACRGVQRGDIVGAPHLSPSSCVAIDDALDERGSDIISAPERAGDKSAKEIICRMPNLFLRYPRGDSICACFYPRRRIGDPSPSSGRWPSGGDSRARTGGADECGEVIPPAAQVPRPPSPFGEG